jgi:hypothetical protein
MLKETIKREKGKIPIATIKQMEADSNTKNTMNYTLSKINNGIHQKRQQYIPPRPSIEAPISPTKNSTRKRKQKNLKKSYNKQQKLRSNYI